MHKRARLLATTGALVLVASLATLAQQATRPGVHPVSGRVFAPVMGYQGADWLDRAERVSEEEPDIALNVLNIAKGSVVADVGAGSGYMSVKLAARVGPTGKVYANDIQPEMLTLLQQRLAQMKITNVETVLGTPTDPRLPAHALDLILMVDVYHEFQQPQLMLRQMREALKPGGRLVLLEYRKEDPSIPIKFEHKMSVAEARAELEAEGYKLTTVDESLPRQHILIFSSP
jgi:ubiquinone/menaquinone biosynthesis C-methylase UbiE